MNKIFKTKYDITTGQCKAVSELASNRQIASSSESKPKCGGFWGNFLRAFKVLPLALLLAGFFSNFAYAANVWLENKKDLSQNGQLNEGTGVWFDGSNMENPSKTESTILSSGENSTGEFAQKAGFKNKSFNRTVVIGSRAVGGGDATTVIGYRAIAGANLSERHKLSSQGTSIGYRTFARGEGATAMGNDSTAWGDNAIAIGSDNAKATSTSQIDSRAERPLSRDVWNLVHSKRSDFLYTDEYATTYQKLDTYDKYLGVKDDSEAYKLKRSHTWARGHNSIAIGARSIAYGDNSTAMGTLATAIGNYSTSLGAFSMAFGDRSIAIGNESYVYAGGSVGVGNEVQAISDGAMVYGLESYAGGDGSIAIGKRALANVEMGDMFKNAVENGKNLYEAESTFSKLGELDNSVQDYFKPSTEYQQGSGEHKAKRNKNSGKQDATGGLAIGYYVSALGENSLALGRQAYAKGDRSMAIGPYAYGAEEKTAALGYRSKAIGKQSMALGSLSRAEGKNSIAIGVNSAVKNESSSNKRNGVNTIAIGNETEATMDNSVALGYKSTTKYFYNKSDNSTATLNGDEAISLPSYAPEGTSYKLQTDNAAGIVSVGWKKSDSELGLRRIVGVAAGALDSDVATVGQLKALYYVKKEGVVTYYTKEPDGKITKLTKDGSKFYRVNTKDGTPYKELQEVDAKDVFVGPKGANEETREEMKDGKKYSLGNMGNLIKFANILDGEISATSDQAVTGGQLNDLNGKLGLTLNSKKTGFEKVQFDAVEVADENVKKGKIENFKEALTDSIAAINRGYKFIDDNSQNSDKDTPFYLGSTIKIVAGNISAQPNSKPQETYLGKNLKTKFEKEPSNNSIAKFTIGLKDDPTFTKVSLEAEQTYNSDPSKNTVKDTKELITKGYLDGALKNVASSFTVKGDDTSKSLSIDKNHTTLTIKGGNNITTAVDTNQKALTISLNESLTGITSISGKNGSGSNRSAVAKIEFDSTASGSNASTPNVKITTGGGTFIFSENGLNLGSKKITGLAEGSDDTDAVTFKQLKDSKLHFLSVKAPTSPESKSNYNNDGAKAEGAIAIGVDAKTDKANAIVIGNSVTVDQEKSIALGNDINIKQSKAGYSTVAIGNKITMNESGGSIVLSAMNQWNGPDDGITLNNVGWGVILGNKTKIEGGNDIVALGNNMNVTRSNGSKHDLNSNLIILGNGAKAHDAKESVVIGNVADVKAQSAVAIGKGATIEANATGAVAIGESATVSTNAGDSIALGKNSKAEMKKAAPTGFTVNAGANDLKITWSSAGAGGSKSVVSVGDKGSERIITNVAAGKVDTDSTEAVNGGQLKSVIDVFANLGVTVLGAEKNDTGDGFKKSKFDAVKTGDTVNSQAQVKSEKPFKTAIEDNITAINKGLKFAGDNGGEAKQLYLGSTLTIKGATGPASKPTTSAGQNGAGTHQNIFTTAKNTGILEIALNEELKGIKSVANGDDVKIELKTTGTGGNGTTKSIVFTAGDTNNKVTLTGNKFSGVSEISSKDSKSKLTLGADNATVELEHGKSKLELKDTEATITAGTDAGSIKINNNGDTKIELSPESGSTVTLAKDSTNGVKATGLSTVGLDGDNTLVFKNGTNSTNTAELKVGGAALTFTSTGNGTGGTAQTVKISNVAAGKIDTSSTEAITGKQLADLATHLGVSVDSGKTGFTAPSFEVIKGGTKDATSGKNGPTTFKGAIDQLITAVNGGLTFKGNDNSSTKLQLGGTLTIDSSTVGSGSEKDITAKLEPSNGNDSKDAGKLTLTLNKATSVDKNDEKVITSKAVATELEKYTKTADLGNAYLKIDGSNIGDASNKKTFGGHVGIAEIKLDGEKSSTELVQADAVIKYLKGTGPDSVKISDSTKTMAKGNYSISIGHEAVSENAESIAIGYMTHAQNKKSIALGNESEVLGEKSIAIGTENKIDGEGKYSTVLGVENKVSSKFTYLIGYNNDIKGDNTFVLGSNILTDNSIKNAVILGDRSKGEANAVSVGGAGDGEQRRIVYVATPTDKYDAVNKQYVDGLGLKFKGNDNKEIHKKLSDTLEIVGKGLNKAQTTKFNGTNGNIAVKENKGKLEISLNRDLKGIKSISDRKNKNIATEIRFNSKNSTSSIPNSLTNNLTISSNGGTFEFNRTGLHINNKQITGLRSGLLEKHNGQDRERKDLNYLIGDEFKNSSIQTHAVNVGDLAKISKEIVEKGYKYKADIPSNNSNDTSIKLGSTISIVKWTDTPATGQPAVTVGTGTTSQTSAVKYTGDNLTTRYTYDSSNGNAKIEIGFKDAPTFSKVTLSQAQTYGKGSSVGNNDLISKSYLDAALKDFKFNVEYGGKQVQIGRGDTLKFADGLNIKLELKEVEKPANEATSTINSNMETSTPAPTTVSTPSDGANDADVATTTAEVTIDTTEELKNITSISSKGSAGGNDADSTVEVTKLTLEADKGATFRVGNTGAKVNVNSDGISLTPKGASGTSPSDDVASITIKAGSKPVDSNSIDLLDPANGPSIAFAAKGGSNGSKEGTGTIKYLKDRTVSKNNGNGDKYGEGDNKGNAATEGAVKELYESGLKFAGNEGEPVHKKLGETLSIKGEGAVGETATDNIVVRAKEGELQIGLTKNIRNIDTISIAGTGDNSGKDVFIDAEGMTTTAQLEDGTVLVNNQTAEGVSTIAKKEDGSILVNNQTAEANILSNGKHTTEVKAGEVAIKDKSGQEIVSLKVAEGENGQDGKGATLAFAKDGENGTGVIMGLKDLDATADGSSAANKNYVDEKMSDLDSNRPFNFYIQEGKEYTKVVKGRDGKFYDPELLQGAKYDVDSKKYIAQDGQEVTPESDKVIIRAEPTTAPIGINNVASGLGILAIEESEKQQLTQAVEDKKNKVSESEKALAQTTADVKSKQQALTEKTNELSQVASERPVLLMQKADLEQQLKGLGASDPRRATAQAALDKVKEALTQNDQKVTEATKTANEASEALKQAKVALADNVLKAYAAQQALATAEETLRNKEFGVDKVKDLLSGSSNIAEDNVATIKDVKALAKAGLSFEGNDGKRLHKDLSETLAIKGEENASGDKFNSNHTAAGNIKVEMAQDGKGLEVKLSDQLKNLTSVETKKDDQGRSTTLLSRGVMVQNDTTKEQAQFSENRLAFFKDGALGLNLDGKSRALKVGEKAIISINDKGEALVSDLNEFSSGMTITNKNYVDTKNNELRTQLNNTDRTLRAGIAGSNAAAGLASVSMPGKSMLAISAAGYGGENAVAIGYSRMSDNGKIMLQLQGNRNSRGKAAGSVSIGYQW
ncbi:hypothetical protein BTV20_09625 [Histophilus somni]|uniref:YadA-like family protein n=1 Tax=Histophilus somni TaxID=731 RepID=A0A9Q6Z0S5_HISSO|nr:YadA-like family protein [Histophilus somni]ACA32034.1 YadA domain protein [Histophilus somni 2336]ARU67508.1 hypothetical protein BTV19_09605 [Histophilus somni]ARU69390.1 hypothetical protein BTV16_09620 [Histophilus somni]ARU71266.1 hypothetical protein BTV20_09625 [Histophilus somni]ARU73137.1 hypothetical protein BTV17_09600 [Histophilus somni]